MTWQAFDAFASYAVPVLAALGVFRVLRTVWQRFTHRGTVVVPPRWRAPARGWGQA